MAKWLEKIKLSGETEERWFHVSGGGANTIYRELPYPFPEQIVFRNKERSFESLERLESGKLKEIGEQLGISYSKVPKEELGIWAKFAAQYDSPTKAHRIIPITPIRKLYEFLRDDFDVRGFREQLLQSFGKATGELIKLCEDSFKAYSMYENCDEGWPSTDRTPLKDPTDLDQVRNTNDLIAILKNENGLPCLDYKYVTYELNPRRTSGRAIFDNGLPAASSGLGGIDVLLRSPEGAPVIGEIKIKDDADPFYATIQSLTYAIETATLHQLDRIRKYGVHDNNCFNKYHGEHVDICIILLNHTKEDMIEASLKLGKEVVSKLSFIGNFDIVKNDGNKFVVC